MEAVSNLAQYFKSWEEGIRHFNERRYWEAHEAWERGWTVLPPERKTHIQGLIQAAAVFHLLGLGRAGAARALARRALEKLAEAPPPCPRIEVPGLGAALARVSGAAETLDGPGARELGLGIARGGLTAELLLSLPP